MKHIIKEGLQIVVKNNPKTARGAISCYFSTDAPQKFSGITGLIARLLLRGTKTKSAQDISLILQDNGIELSSESKQDFLRIETVFLNQDLDLTLDIMEDILKNSTFDELDKEIFKLKGEIDSILDSSTSKLSDGFTRELFKGHIYENTITKTLEDIPNINKDIIKEFYEIILNSKTIITAVGDFEDEDEIAQKLLNKFGFLNKFKQYEKIKDIKELNENKIVKIAKNSANQAHVLQGWVVDTVNSEDYAKLLVMNNLMGSSGLSSRLFYELRDKQGLAYTVRSTYDAMLHSAVLSFYIGTTPNNIKKSLEGFRIEIEKLQKNLPTDDELQGAKENVLGRYAYFSQTNSQIATTTGHDLIMNRPINYRKIYPDMINSVTKEDLSYMAQKYLSNNSIIAVIAPDNYLDF